MKFIAEYQIIKMSENKTPKSSPRHNLSISSQSMETNHPFKRLIIFQLKLALDAMRDILLSPISIVCTLLDLSQKNNKNQPGYFDKLMMLGRNTEKKINLFEQHRPGDSTVDSVLSQVESVVMNEYKNKNLSSKALSTIQEILKK